MLFLRTCTRAFKRTMSTSSNIPRPRVAFISGPLAPSATFFEIHYLPAIIAAVAVNHHFVLGPSRGIDTLALSYLLSSRVPPSHITVFVAKNQASMLPRFKEKGVNCVVAGSSHTGRDEACTRASDYDILKYLSETEARAEYGASYRPRISGTEKNELRRRDLARMLERAKVEARVATEVAVKARPMDQEAKLRRKHGKWLRDARELRARLESGEKLEENQKAKVQQLEEMEKVEQLEQKENRSC